MLLYSPESEAAWGKYREASRAIWDGYGAAADFHVKAWRTGKLTFEAYGDIAEKLYGEAEAKEEAAWLNLQTKKAEIKAKYA